MNYIRKVQTYPFGGEQVTMRELTAREFQELQEKFPDGQGIQCAAQLLHKAMVEPKYGSVEEIEQMLLDLPLRGVKELVGLAEKTSGLEAKN